jgi:hypothetical protein
MTQQTQSYGTFITEKIETRLRELDTVTNAMSEALHGDFVEMLESADTVYISGPMTGLPDMNFRSFNELAILMREHGFTVLNPASYHDPGHEWQHYLKVDLLVVEHCKVIALLPGWEKSVGARLEVAHGILHGLTIIEVGRDLHNRATYPEFFTHYLPGEDDGLGFLKEIM